MVHTSDDVMRLERQPKRSIIVGGGYVAAELGHVCEALGTEVTIVHRGERLLSDEDDDVSSRFRQAYARRSTSASRQRSRAWRGVARR